MKQILLLTLLLSFIFNAATAQGSPLSSPDSSKVSIRLLTNLNPSYVFFTVSSGKYEIDYCGKEVITVNAGESLIIARYNGKIALRTISSPAFLADSILFKGVTGYDCFSLRTNTGEPFSGNYSGDLQCFPDLGALLLINSCDIESYVAGVVRAEGGSGKNSQFFRTQAIIARTYTYKYFNKHLIDRYNLCDDTHCQAFLGVINDSIINEAVLQTKGLVITTPDSNLIISAFHSNCGGETSPSEFVWLTELPYLKKVVDPYCITSRNSEWKKTVSLKEWSGLLAKNGFTGSSEDASAFIFDQPSRVQNYVTGTFSLPLRIIRDEFDLRSSFFSVFAAGDSLLLKGKGYGHGVGLCQEGAMVMAGKGFSYEEIIKFYYQGVIITEIESAKKTGNEK
jgi:stage II sporulation protein D